MKGSHDLSRVVVNRTNAYYYTLDPYYNGQNNVDCIYRLNNTNSNKDSFNHLNDSIFKYYIY